MRRKARWAMQKDHFRLRLELFDKQVAERWRLFEENAKKMMHLVKDNQLLHSNQMNDHHRIQTETFNKQSAQFMFLKYDLMLQQETKKKIRKLQKAEASETLTAQEMEISIWERSTQQRRERMQKNDDDLRLKLELERPADDQHQHHHQHDAIQ
eukprot:TRINITY_DN78_c0_g1_i3.p1 TRINITY_DN78_c0_g1~~TRINITY_DN78_c0_g1_i3.p1  ORF type:complete len:167 (+),score=55.00 TRINITY_DN78_c0_g1_i3:42-503(+)